MISLSGKEDPEEIMQLIKKATEHMESNGIFQWDEVYPDVDTIKEDILKNNLYSFKQGNKIAGIIVLNESDTPEYNDIDWTIPGRKFLYVHRLCILPDEQGKGISKLLMNFAAEFGRKNNYDVIRLDAFTQNPAAINLYKSLNYNLAGTCGLRKGNFHCFEKKL